MAMAGGLGAPPPPPSGVAREVIDVLGQFEEVGGDGMLLGRFRLGGRLRNGGMGFLAVWEVEWWWWWGLLFVGIVGRLDHGDVTLLDVGPGWVFLRAVVFGFEVGNA